MPSFYSSKLLEDRIAEINHDIPIIIIENSKDIQLKKKLENNFQNVKVIIPHENLGWGKAVNLGIKESKTQMVFISQPDVKLIDDCVNKLIDCTKNFKDFSLLAPLDLNNKDFTNYEIYESYQKINKNNKFRLEEVDYVDLSWLINKDNWLKELNTIVEIGKLTKINLQRVTQLFNKTNQFNLTTRRLSEDEIKNYYSSVENNLITIDVKDKFGKLWYSKGDFLAPCTDEVALEVEVWDFVAREFLGPNAVKALKHHPKRTKHTEPLPKRSKRLQTQLRNF